MPIYSTTFPQDFWEHNFPGGGGDMALPQNCLCLHPSKQVRVRNSYNIELVRCLYFVSFKKCLKFSQLAASSGSTVDEIGDQWISVWVQFFTACSIQIFFFFLFTFQSKSQVGPKKISPVWASHMRIGSARTPMGRPYAVWVNS